MRIAVFLALGLAGAAGAADLSGRWEGEAAIPGAPLPIVVDVARANAGGGWAGSVILPGRAVSGAPLRELAVGDDGLRASLAAAFAGGGGATAPALALRLQPDGTLAGTFELGGRSAPLRLARTGAAQVTPAPASTPVSAALAGTWRGSYELGGQPRQVTLTLTAGAPGSAELVIVGKRTTQVPIDRYAQNESFVTLESAAFGITIDGRWRTPDGAISATFTQGPFEVPLVLRRAGGGS